MHMLQLFDTIQTALKGSGTKIKPRTKFMVQDLLDAYSKLKEKMKKESSSSGENGGQPRRS